MAEVNLETRRERLLLALVEAENALDLDALLEIFPNPRYELIGTQRVYAGVEQVSAHLTERRHAFPDCHSELIALFHAQDAVIAEAWFAGTHLGQIEDLEPSGRGFRCRMAVIFLFDGLDLKCQRIYFDQSTIARQLA